MSQTESKGEPFEYIFEQEVKASKAERYYEFSDKLHALASKQPGFIHQERRPLNQAGEVWRFQTVVKFDTVQHCIDWLENPERRRLLRMEEEEAEFAFQGHANWSGYARWLSRSLTKEPPKWKVNLLVLLTLYPTVMVLTPLLHLTMNGVSYPVVMLVSNSICVAATSWVFVPFVSRFYLRWLEGDMRFPGKLLPTASLVIFFAALLFLFRSLPKSLWG